MQYQRVTVYHFGLEMAPLFFLVDTLNDIGIVIFLVMLVLFVVLDEGFIDERRNDTLEWE